MKPGEIGFVAHIESAAGFDRQIRGAAVPVHLERAAGFDCGLLKPSGPIGINKSAGLDGRLDGGAVVCIKRAEHGRTAGDGTIIHIEVRLGIDERVARGLPGIQGCFRPPPDGIVPDDLAAGNHCIVELGKADILIQRDVVERRAGCKLDIPRVCIVAEPEVGPGGDDHVFRRGAVIDRQSRAGIHGDPNGRLVPVKLGTCAVRHRKRGENKVAVDHLGRRKLEAVYKHALLECRILQDDIVVQIQSAPCLHVQIDDGSIVVELHLAVGVDRDIAHDIVSVGIEISSGEDGRAVDFGCLKHFEPSIAADRNVLSIA